MTAELVLVTMIASIMLGLLLFIIADIDQRSLLQAAGLVFLFLAIIFGLIPEIKVLIYGVTLAAICIIIDCLDFYFFAGYRLRRFLYSFSNKP